MNLSMMKSFFLKRFLSLTILLITAVASFAQNAKDFPPRPNPPRLVNDLAGMMTPAQQDELERLLVNFDNTTSTQITIVTIKSLGDYEPSQYATQLGQNWGVGRKDKNNGVVILASAEDRKVAIATAYGIEGALTDAMSGRIIRNEIVPEFKAGNYYNGFSKAANSIIAATKGEYTNDDPPDAGGGGGIVPIIIILIIFIVIIIAAIKGGGGRGGGNYMSRRGGDFLTGAILGSILSGGRSGGSDWGGGSGGSSGGFGGFGGGSFGGGGASGSW
jgi:uncharacterized protein